MLDAGPCKDASEWLQLGQGVLNVVQVVLLAWIANHAMKKNELDHRRWQMNFNEQAKVRRELRNGGTSETDADA